MGQLPKTNTEIEDKVGIQNKVLGIHHVQPHGSDCSSNIGTSRSELIYTQKTKPRFLGFGP